MILDPVSDIPPESQYRPRRSHKKSRNGCLRCKQRRKKCDEIKPCCTRCADQDLACQYPKKIPKEKAVDIPSQGDDSSHSLNHHSSPGPSPTYLTPLFQSWTLTSSSLNVTPSQSPCPSPGLFSSRSEYDETALIGAQPEEFLDSTELELLSHYVTHTARVIAFDREDLYALQVGFPNLAFHSRPLMKSIMALSAVCKCNDIMTQSGVSRENRDQIRELLAFADQHHRESLRQTQTEIPVATQYDYVLANAPLMVLYGNAVHCVRIRLTEWAMANDEPLVGEFVPAQSQWMSLIRAAHVAYKGILNDQAYRTSELQESWPRPGLPGLPGQDGFPTKLEPVTPEDGPTDQTKRLLLPIIAGTAQRSLERLQAKAQTLRGGNTPGTKLEDKVPMNSFDIELQACYTALEVLGRVMTDVLNVPGFVQTQSPPKTDDHLTPFSRLSEVSPWLQSYLACVTMVKPTRAWRRDVTAFVNRVPAEYLSMVRTTLDLLPGPTAGGEQHLEAGGFAVQHAGIADRLAMDIFAHWLVLMMLLDSVWWIGDIGAWELGRVVAFMRSQGWAGTPEEKWWPEYIYKIKTDLKKYVEDDTYIDDMIASYLG